MENLEIRILPGKEEELKDLIKKFVFYIEKTFSV